MCKVDWEEGWKQDIGICILDHVFPEVLQLKKERTGGIRVSVFKKINVSKYIW